MVAEDAKGTGGVAEARCGERGGQAVDKEGTKRLVLTMSGVGWFKEGALEWCYIFSFVD
jgi:hypothetical protein